MSILIKGVEKPKECYCCPCSTINMNGRWGKCNLLGRDYAGDPHKIYNDCPLVEIPPHGRLIDASEMAIKFNCLDIDITTVKKLHELLMEIPTVIESEEQEHE